MNKEMKKRLNTFSGTGILISIYSDTDDPDSFTFGYLLQMDEEAILMNMINQFGEENGFCTINIDDIFIYDEDKMYSEKMRKLFEIKNQKSRYIEELDTTAINNLLKYAIKNKLLIEVNEDDNYVGFVTYFSENTLVLQLTDNYGNNIGNATMDMDNINVLKCQNRYLKDLELIISGKNILCDN